MVSKCIRQVEDKDIDNVIEFMAKCYKVMDYKSEAPIYDPVSTKKSLKYLIKNDSALFLIYIKNNKIMGIFGAGIAPSLLNHNFIQAEEQVWHADPLLKPIQRVRIMIELLESFEYKIKRLRQIDAIHIIFKNKNLIKFLKKRGYTEIQYHCIKEAN